MRERAFAFWCRWLLISSGGFCLFGVLIAVFPDARLLAPWTAAAAERFHGGVEPPEAAAMRAFLFGTLGSTMAGSYLLQAFVIRFAFARRERWAWWATLAALLLWFGVDSALSLAHGAAFNVWMINVVPLVIFGLPLMATRRAFTRRSAASQSAGPFRR